MKERFKIIPEICLILIQEGKVVMLRRFQTGYQDGNYCLPAGHGEEGETMREAIAREAFEEIGITVASEDMEFALVQYRFAPDPWNHHVRVGFYFVPKTYTGTIHNAEPHKCDDVQLFPLDQLPENTVPFVRAALEAHARGENYNEFNWEARTN